MIMEYASSERMYIPQATGMYEDPQGAITVPFQDAEKFMGRSPIEIAHQSKVYVFTISVNRDCKTSTHDHPPFQSIPETCKNYAKLGSRDIV